MMRIFAPILRDNEACLHVLRFWLRSVDNRGSLTPRLVCCVVFHCSGSRCFYRSYLEKVALTKKPDIIV